jgi:hypothetical protein
MHADTLSKHAYNRLSYYRQSGAHSDMLWKRLQCSTLPFQCSIGTRFQAPLLAQCSVAGWGAMPFHHMHLHKRSQRQSLQLLPITLQCSVAGCRAGLWQEHALLTVRLGVMLMLAQLQVSRAYLEQTEDIAWLPEHQEGPSARETSLLCGLKHLERPSRGNTGACVSGWQL